MTTDNATNAECEELRGRLQRAVDELVSGRDLAPPEAFKMSGAAARLQCLIEGRTDWGPAETIIAEARGLLALYEPQQPTPTRPAAAVAGHKSVNAAMANIFGESK